MKTWGLGECWKHTFAALDVSSMCSVYEKWITRVSLRTHLTNPTEGLSTTNWPVLSDCFSVMKGKDRWRNCPEKRTLRGVDSQMEYMIRDTIWEFLSFLLQKTSLGTIGKI